MAYKVKSMWCLIFNRLWEREKRVLIWFIISIAIVVAYELITADCVLEFADCHNFVETIISFLSKGKELFYALAISYISGVFVYFLTVILPETRRSKPILLEIEHTLKYLIDEFYEIENFGNSTNAVNIAIEKTKHYGKFNDLHYSLYYMCETLENIHISIEKLTSNVLTLSTALTNKELDTLIEIRHRKITRQIKYKYGVENLIDENELRCYFENMTKLHEDIVKLYENIKNRIYKQ